MRRRFVVDASIAVAWVHPTQATTETDGLLDEVERGARPVVPTLWFLEVANALLVLERRKKIRSEERATALRTLHGLDPEVDDAGHRLAFNKVSELATLHDLSIYDACYVELALRERLPLATKDDSLRAVARRAGVRMR
ncbi:MAG: type II toxin-antitoxin system VapC family toxin [Candidatus Binatia bacterium]